MANRVVCRCGNPISSKRLALKLNTCISCGQKKAETEIERRKGLVGPSHNKGTLTYYGSDPKTARKNLMELGTKNPRSIGDTGVSSGHSYQDYLDKKRAAVNEKPRYRASLSHYERDTKGQRWAVFKKEPLNDAARHELTCGGPDSYRTKSDR